MNFNKVIIAGRLTRDPETRTMPDGRPVTTFGVATNKFFTDKEGNKQENTEFHNVTSFGKLADICSRYLKKGMPVLAEGYLKTRNWQDKEGVKRSRTDIILENMQMGPRSASSGFSPSSPLQKEQTISNEDIPIIETDEILKEPKNSTRQTETEKSQGAVKNDFTSALSDNEGEIEVKDIPF